MIDSALTTWFLAKLQLHTPKISVLSLLSFAAAINPFLERVVRSGAILAPTSARLGLADSLDKWTAATEFSLPS